MQEVLLQDVNKNLLKNASKKCPTVWRRNRKDHSTFGAERNDHLTVCVAPNFVRTQMISA